MNLLEKIYWVGVEKYLEKTATSEESTSHNDIYDAFLRTKLKYDPYFSTILGGILGAGLGSLFEKSVTPIFGGGVGSFLGYLMATKKDENQEKVGFSLPTAAANIARSAIGTTLNPAAATTRRLAGTNMAAPTPFGARVSRAGEATSSIPVASSVSAIAPSATPIMTSAAMPMRI